MSWEERVEAAAAAVEGTLAHQLHELNGLLPLKWVVAFEYLDAEGNRDVASMASPGLMKWDVAGLLTHILRNDDLDSLRQIIQGERDA